MHLKNLLKKWLFGLLGKDPEAVVLCFVTGPEDLCRRMVEQITGLTPDRRHFIARLGPAAGWERHPVVSLHPAGAAGLYLQLRRAFRRYRIGLAPVFFDHDSSYRSLRLAAFLLAPSRILAFNTLLERHHLRLRTWLASWLFLRGVPVDRIFLRPWWLWPWKKDRSVYPETFTTHEGRPLDPARKRVAVLSPYFPYPLSHGGAVRIFNLLKAASRQFDIFLLTFTEDDQPLELAPVLDFCAQVVLCCKPRYREPRWSSWLPPEVHEYNSPAMRKALDHLRHRYAIQLVQIEYTQLASYRGDVLVEHDVTFDLYQQIYRRTKTLAAWWDCFRWRRFEARAVRRFPRVVVMAEKDRLLLGRPPNVTVIPNGVDLDRFQPWPEPEGHRLLFIGSFRHHPNIQAYRFLVEHVWPVVASKLPSATLTVVAGPTAGLFWRLSQGSELPPPPPGVQMLEFIADVRPLYGEANLVLVPTVVSAGTNIKVLEAMAMQRAIVSTSCGCAGLGLEHGRNVWIADTARDFADAVLRLLADTNLRRGLAQQARIHAERNFSWKIIGTLQRQLWHQLLGQQTFVRQATEADLPAIAAIQSVSPEAARWNPEDYLQTGCLVAELDSRLAGFLAYRHTAADETEILNLAVHPEVRRRGVATCLLQELMALADGSIYLEVRASNLPARNLYRKLGFRETALRPSYYDSPPEDGIVMKL